MRQIQRTFLVRKLMPAFMAICAFFMFMPTALAAENDTGTDLGFSWRELADGTVEVTGYTGGFTMDVTIPDTLSGKTVTAIAKDAFNRCPDFCGRVTLPSTLKTIGEMAFYMCASMTDTNLPEGLTTIGNSAFGTCSSLNDVTFPSTLTSIGDCAFSNCDGFTNITLHAGLDIGNYAFSFCEGITSVTIPEGISTMGLGTFENCTKLESVTIPSTMTTIPSNMFNSCTKLNSVTLPSTLKTIGLGAFNNCQTLENITIPQGVTKIDIQSFSCCIKLKEITIPQSVTSIGNGAFEFCPELTDVTILGSTPIGANAFDECRKLESITMTKVTSIGAYAFRKCEALTSVTIPNTVSSLGECAFARCKSLTSVTVPGSVNTIGDSAFSECTALTEATLEDGVQEISKNAFSECTSLANVTIPNSVTAMGEYAFSETSITNVTIPGSLKVIAEGLFGACAQLENVTIPDCVTTIDSLAFAYCPLLTEITIPSSVTSIGDKSFWNTGLSKIIILNPNAAFGAEVFLDTTLSDGIYGFGGSTAETYATDNSIPFHALCTVVFDTNGGSEISDIYPIPGDKISAPEAPTKDGYTFEGWYKEEACTNAWNFDTDTVSGDMTLYAKWKAIPQPTPVPTPQPTPNPDKKLITVTGTLLGDDGEPLAGYTVELHSTPRTTVTDAKGRYTFADVEVADHSLTLKDKEGSTLKSFAIAVQSGEDFVWSKPDDDSITAVVQDDTASIDVTIKIADDGTVTVNNIKNIVNPKTGSSDEIAVYILAVSGLALMLAAMFLWKKRLTSKAYNALYPKY